MAADTPFTGEPADSREAIMRATYCALEQYGYAGLSIQRIADEADLSKSTFYHHYDNKDDLLTSFVDFILAEFSRIFSMEASEDPLAQLQTYVHLILDLESADGVSDTTSTERVLGTYVELRAQGVRDKEFREKYTEVDQTFEQQLADIIEDGIEAGVFKDVDPDRTATFLLTLIAGHTFRHSTREDDFTDAVRTEVDEYIEYRLVRTGT